MAKRLPSSRWYQVMNAYYAKMHSTEVRAELNINTELKAALGTHCEAFIKWAGTERLVYEANLEEEINDFLEQIKSVELRLFQINPEEWKTISLTVFKRDDFTCTYCGHKGGILECDHVIPVSRGGGNDLENLTTACRKCNRQKRDKTGDEFRTWLKR